MVMAWLAKEDLTHFFTLLEGERGVDQSRLFYWLRYANQMGFTRIVLGTAAQTDMSPDFIEFRGKNKGRLSHLQNSPANNNAVIMQIGDYYFVEFSSTGNACYAYAAKNTPFNPESVNLSLTLDLKNKGFALARWNHTPAPWRDNEVVGWLEKFDQELSYLGIHPGHTRDTKEKENKKYYQYRPSASVKKKAVAEHDLANSLREQLEHLGCRIIDNRLKGGALKVQMKQRNAHVEQYLKNLGFKAEALNPLNYWRS